MDHIADELSSKLQGTAKVSLDFLSFDPLDQPDRDNVERLVKIFHAEGCNRLNPLHFVSGTVTTDALQASLAYSNLTLDDLRRSAPPTLRLAPGRHIECLHGKHRVAALRESRYLSPWWTVRLYTDLSTDAKRALAEDSSNEGKLSDGIIFLNILKHPPKSQGANRWLAKLSTSAANIAKKLNNRDTLAAALRIVLEIPGLRKGFKLGVWNKIVSERCDEEIIHYLRLIYDTFVFIMESEDALAFVDDEGAQELEMRTPGMSLRDEFHIADVIRKNLILRGLVDEPAREQVIRRLGKVEHLIPTIHTLQRDFYYLQQCTSVMRRLVSGKRRLPVTVQSLARNAYVPNPASPFDPESEFLGCLKRLYLHIMQNVVELTGESPLMEEDEEKPEHRQGDERSWVELAIVARDMGFASDEIARLCSMNPDQEAVSKFLLTIRPPARFSYGQNLDRLIDAVVDIVNKAQPLQGDLGRPVLTTKFAGEPVARRCGRQFSRAYAHDRHFLTPYWFTCEMQKSIDVTSLFVRRSVFHAFWGFHDDPEDGPREEDMPDVTEEEPATGTPCQAAAPSDPSVCVDEEMKDAPAFSRLMQRKRPRKDTEKKKQQRERQQDLQVRQQPETEAALSDRRDTAVTMSIPNVPALRSEQPDGRNQVSQPDNREMTILIRDESGSWVDAKRCRRRSIIEGIDEVRRANPEQDLSLYDKDGLGLEVADCPTHENDFVCLTKDKTGFPADEIL